MRVGVNLQSLRPGSIGGLESYVRNLIHWLPRLDGDLELVLFGTEYNASVSERKTSRHWMRPGCASDGSTFGSVPCWRSNRWIRGFLRW